MSALLPPPINTLPVGLLSFLGIKSMGENPKQFPVTTQAVLDLRWAYLAGSPISTFARSNTAAIFIGTVGQAGVAASGVQIPPGECWMVIGARIQCEGIPAATTAFSLAFSASIPGAVVEILGPTISGAGAATAKAFLAVMDPAFTGRVFTSGTYFDAYWTNVEGANIGAGLVAVVITYIKLNP